MNYLFDEVDKTLASVGVIFSVILIIWLKLVLDYPIYVMIGILCFTACIGYLIIRRFLHPSLIPDLEKLRCSTRFYITLNILFFLILSYSIILIYLRPEPYSRPIGYFISTSLMAVIVANEILFLSTQKSYIYFALFKIIIIGLSLGFSQILIFPSIVGVDNWWHQWFTLEILDKGYIPEYLGYSKLPLMHLMIGMTSLVTDLGYKIASMLSISFLQVVCDAFFVFLLGRFLISTKVGLLAALVLEVSNYHISYGFEVMPNTMAAILILPIIFILFKIRIDKPFIGFSVGILLMGTMILTHTLTSMCLAILLFVFWLSSMAYTRLFYQENDRSITWMICILFSTMMLAYWTYISGHILTLGILINLGFYNRKLEMRFQYINNIPLLEQLFSYLGTFLFFSLSFIGCFYIISKTFRSRNRIIITTGGLSILFLSFFTQIAGKHIIVSRWYYFSHILMAIPLSLSLFLLNGIFKNKLIKGLLMSLSIFTLSFLLIISPVANIDNRLYSPDSKFRRTFIESELHAMDTISEIWDGRIGSDQYVKRPYELQFNRELEYIDNSLSSGDFSDLQGIMILIREEIVKYSFRTKTGSLKLKYDLHIALYNQKFSRIYNSGSTSGYLKP